MTHSFWGTRQLSLARAAGVAYISAVQANARSPLSQGYVESMMDREWNDGQPIYRQLRDLVAAMILDGVLNEGDPLPSVRNVAAEYRVNPLTVLKAYQELVDEQLVESKRGRGMYINPGARALLMDAERQKFLEEQWPRVYATIQRLGLTAEELLKRDPAADAPPEGS
jgi:GntR family transcriptional regulator